MRKIYLVRHGQPFFPGRERCCLGSADFPLSTLGRLQACLLVKAFEGKKVTVFSSPLSRAYDTACAISPTPVVLDELREMHAGDWDGLSFREIKERWPGLFEARAYDKELLIPGSEDWHEGQRRFLAGVKKAIDSSEGDIVIVAHTTVILSLICHVMGSEEFRDFKYRQGCGSWYMLEENVGSMRCIFPWESPRPELDDALCLKLLQAANLPEHIIAHCKAVAAEAGHIADALIKAGISLDRELIYTSALLHDIARLEDHHPETGASWLMKLGYERHAEIIRQHHDIESESIDEAAVVYIADKLIQGAEKVSLRARFEKSREKCKSPESLAAHELRAQQTLGIAGKINSLCKKELIT